MPRILNRSEAAEFFSVSLPTVDDWIRRGCPAEKRGSNWRIDPAAVLAWHRDAERQNALGDLAQVDESEARRRKMAAEAAIKEHELAIVQRSAVSIADFESAWQAMIGAARAKLLGIGAGIGPEVAVMSSPHECSQAIHGAICEALQELSESAIELPDVSARPDGDQPPDGKTSPSVVSPAGVDRKRMGGSGAKTQPRKQR